MTSTKAKMVCLGVCERVQVVDQGHPGLPKHNILGFKNPIVSYIFPFNLEGLHLALGIYNVQELRSIKVRGVLSDGGELFYINITTKIDKNLFTDQKLVENGEIRENELRQHFGFLINDQEPTWRFFTVPMPAKVFLKEPDTIRVTANFDGIEEIIGLIEFVIARPSELTIDRIDAIRSNPNAAKSIQFFLTCNNCGDELKTYAGLQRNGDMEKNGWIWNRELPEKFQCKCSSQNFSLRYLREGLHGLLGNLMKDDGGIEFHRLYERGVLESITNNFWSLIDEKPREEDIQKFIELNPVVFQGFNPQRIFFKSPILSKYNTDFVILDNRGYLLLVEIERANIRLLKKDGSISAELEHAITQANDWLYKFDQHRSAILEDIGISPKEVVKVLGVVIAGRDNTQYATEHLQKLKWRDFGKISFYTYDDVGKNLFGLINRFSQL